MPWTIWWQSSRIQSPFATRRNMMRLSRRRSTCFERSSPVEPGRTQAKALWIINPVLRDLRAGPRWHERILHGAAGIVGRLVIASREGPIEVALLLMHAQVPFRIKRPMKFGFVYPHGPHSLLKRPVRLQNGNRHLTSISTNLITGHAGKG